MLMANLLARLELNLAIQALWGLNVYLNFGFLVCEDEGEKPGGNVCEKNFSDRQR